MKKKQITKLFAVMAMAASPAAAGTALDPWAMSAVSPLDHSAASEAMAAIINIGFAAVSHPRELVTGAPAPGNVTSRPIPGAEPRPAPIVAARPRTMPSGAPACGNVATRAARPADCSPVGQVLTAGDVASPVVATPVAQQRPATARPSRARSASRGGAK